MERRRARPHGDEAVGEIFATINQDRGQAAAKTLGYLGRGGSAEHLFDAARRMIFHKGTDSHDYKYGAAIWEECLAASDPDGAPAGRRRAMFNLPGAKTADSPLMIRAARGGREGDGLSDGPLDSGGLSFLIPRAL